MTADSIGGIGARRRDPDPGAVRHARRGRRAALSYALNLEVGAEAGIDADAVRDVLTAIAPIVGTARVASATGDIVRALAAEIKLEDLGIALLEEDDEE